MIRLNRAVLLPLLVAGCGVEPSRDPAAEHAAFVATCKNLVKRHNDALDAQWAKADKLGDDVKTLEEYNRSYRDRQKLEMSEEKAKENYAAELDPIIERRLAECRMRGIIRQRGEL